MQLGLLGFLLTTDRTPTRPWLMQVHAGKGLAGLAACYCNPTARYSLQLLLFRRGYDLNSSRSNLHAASREYCSLKPTMR